MNSRSLGPWDSSLLVFLASLRRGAAARNLAFDDTGLPPAAARLLALSAEAVHFAKRSRSANRLVTRVHNETIDAGAEAVAIMTWSAIPC